MNFIKFFVSILLILLTIQVFALNWIKRKDKTIEVTPQEKEFLSKPEADKIKTTEEVTACNEKPQAPTDKNHEPITLERNLIDATIAKNFELIKELIEQKKVDPNAAPCQGITALHLASNNGAYDIV